jgi:hypothetical protein
MTDLLRSASLALLVICSVASAQTNGPPAPECADGAECPAENEQPITDTWVDKSFNYMTTRADSTAVWLDSFFGRPETDLESADSVLRLRMEHEWDEVKDDKTRIRLRGKVNLPRIDHRLSLVFSEDDEDLDDVVPQVEHRDEDIGLQYRIHQRDHSRLYLSFSTNSSLDFKSSLRYRQIETFSENWRGEFSERLYYTEDDGFGTLTRVGLDRALGPDHLVRWIAQADYNEESAGVRWSSKVSHSTRLSERSGFSVFGAVSGVTDPHYLTDAYALGIRYRRSVFRRWIFVEVEPAHVWRRPTLWEPREPLWVLTLRLEFLEEVRDRRRRN